MLLLRCPKCRNKMKYNSASKDLTKKRKACVYCGKSFSVKSNVIQRL